MKKAEKKALNMGLSVAEVQRKVVFMDCIGSSSLSSSSSSSFWMSKIHVLFFATFSI